MRALKIFLSCCEKTGIGELNACVKAATKAEGERTLTWQGNGFCQLENCRLVGVLFYLTSILLGNSEAIVNKKVIRVTITECKQPTDGITF